MATQVVGGPHHGGSFFPRNGVSAKQIVETQIVALREQKQKRFKRTERKTGWGKR